MTSNHMKTALLILVAAAFVLTGCGGDDAQKETASVPAASVPAADDHSGHDHAQSMPPSNAFLSGTVLETMNSGGYSYVHLDAGDRQVWIAGPETPGLDVGKKISIADGMEMQNFTAKSLDRQFDSILFTGGIQVAGASAMGSPADHPTSEHPTSEHPTAGQQTGQGTTTVAKTEVADIQPLADGYSVADIYNKASDLGGKTVKLRGKVVKFTPNIMGTNWMHIQDGSGEDGSSDLTITTSAMVAKGDVVVVEGPLSVDKDFGAGYKYHVIVENATVTKQ